MALLLPVLGAAGAVVDELLVLPLLELDPDLLKWASHSEREIWPSLLVSTDEKLGCDALPEVELVLGELELPLAADGEAADGLVEDFEDESAATASVDRAKSAAAVVMVTVFSIGMASCGWENNPTDANAVPAGCSVAGRTKG